MARSNPQNIDQLRERLRGLGYLDAPVDRYVLGSAADTAGAGRFAFAAGLRVGIVAGLLLGISAEMALAARAPGFISTRRDGAVLAVMLSALFTLAAAAAVTITALAASWFARRAGGVTAPRARMVAATAGIIVALACAAYLTLWWSAAQDLFTPLSFAWNAAALALAAAVSLLLAHAVSVVILAALVRQAASTDIRAGGVLSSRGFLLAFGVILFAGSAGLLATGAADHAGAADPPRITVVPTGYALRVIAIDGFDTGQPTASDMPALMRLRNGASLPLHPDRSSAPEPARDWTTIATGRTPQVHGITSLEARRAVGIQGRLLAASSGFMRSLLNAADLLRLTTPSLATGEERRVPAFWEVASAAGLRTSVVNWWATWPAPEGDDIVITDRALLRLDAGGQLDAEIAPASVYESLRAQWAAMRSAASARAAAAFQNVGDPELRKVMVRSAELDILIAGLGKINAGRPLDLQVTYLPGLDIAQHNLLQASAAASVSAVSERVAAIERYYRFLDELIAELLPPSTAHIDAVILWPGRVTGREGALHLAGGPVVRGAMSCSSCETDVVATLLYLLGLPIAENLGADVAAVSSVASAEFQKRFPMRAIANYDAARARRSVRTGQPLDAEALERLRSLGYIR